LPRRVQTAFAALALVVAPGEALDIIALRLGVPRGGDDLIVRQYLVKQVGARNGDATAIKVLGVALADPSEHVRIALPAAIAGVGGLIALDLIRTIAFNPKESPRVRAACAPAVAQLCRRGNDEAFTVLRVLVEDRAPLVARLAAEEAGALAEAGVVQGPRAQRLIGAASHAAATAVDGAAAESALRALESLVARCTPEGAQTDRDLLTQLQKVPADRPLVVRSSLPPPLFGRVLARAARDTLGLYADVVPGGYRVFRGARMTRRLWRFLHELRTRTPYKRQDQVHTLGRFYPGTLRAHSSRLGEATGTLPGEPLTVARNGGWGPHLPTVDDLLSMSVMSDQPITLYTARGMTLVRPPDGLGARLHARVMLSLRYADLASLRLRALEPRDAAEITRYVESLERAGYSLSFSPYPEADPSKQLAPVVAGPFGNRFESSGLARASAAASQIGAAGTHLVLVPPVVGEALQYGTSLSHNSLAHLGLATVVLGAGLLLRNLLHRDQIKCDRAAIPLVIGGWGTRGKSGTERLKAALFHGAGIEVLVKTTGCEAMFIHGVPGRRPTEIFIHRSYDKATIWEQRDLLSLAARLRVRTFLWECMALSPPLVEVLQEEWMRDDLSTLTNAYPDHEDVQGPAGHDVARAIASFIRRGGTTITSEEQMLPILAEQAAQRGARLEVVPSHEHELLADDLLGRFPYQEHPRNIALVRRLAVELGLDPDLATADMADHVVPDLGVLRSYPEVDCRGRALTFVNGMSANERTGFVSNWERTGCERPVDESGRWVVTVINNRFDRVARSKVFADIVVRDAAAERHVLIGTNLSGLRSYIDESLERYLEELTPFRGDETPLGLESVVETRLAGMRHRLRIGAATVEAIERELGAWGVTDVHRIVPLLRDALAAATAGAQAGQGFAQIREALMRLPLAKAAALLRCGIREEQAAWLSRSVARRAVMADVERRAREAVVQPSQRAAACERTRRAYHELFGEMIVSVDDPTATGDQVIDEIARACPPGARVTLMGAQNIKGTGLDFVYRFIRYAEVNEILERLCRTDPEETPAIATELLARSDWGWLDAAKAEETLRQIAAGLGDHRAATQVRNVAERVAVIARAAREAVEHRTKVGRSGAAVAQRVVEKTFDALDAVARRWRAEAVLDALVHREISHERAALEMRRLVDREKKGWLHRREHRLRNRAAWLPAP
jgi:poly-gamma-glutamate synthase PgsB/CapB